MNPRPLFSPVLILMVFAMLLQGCKKETAQSNPPSGAKGSSGSGAPSGDAESEGGGTTAALPATMPAPPPRNPPMDLGTLTPDALLAKCKADPQARKNLEGATIALTGTVVAVTRDTSSRAYLTLDTKPGTLYCYPVDPQPWKTIGHGQQVKVSGILGFDTFDKPRVVQATVQSQGPSTVVAANAEAIQAQYAADPKSTDTRYAGKSVLVTGKVSSKQVKGTSAILYLGGDDNPVHCQFTGYSETLTKAFAPIKVGQTITVVGVWTSTLDRADPPKWAKLMDCNLVQ